MQFSRLPVASSVARSLSHAAHQVTSNQPHMHNMHGSRGTGHGNCLNNAYMHFARSYLRLAVLVTLCSAWGCSLHCFATVCSTWVAVSRGSTGRSLACPMGNLSFGQVYLANQMVYRCLGCVLKVNVAQTGLTDHVVFSDCSH